MSTATSPAGDDDSENVLSDSDRRYIFDIEGVALALDVHTFPKLARAIRDGDRAALAAFLSDNFTGRVPDVDRHSAVVYPFGRFESINDADESWITVDKAGFVGFLLDQSKRLPRPRSDDADPEPPARTEFLSRDPRVEVRIMRLAPVEREVLGSTWQGTMKIRFAGRRPTGEPGELELSAQFTLDAPDKDKLPEQPGWLKSCRVYASRMRDASGILLKEVGAERGIDRSRFHDNWDHPKDPPMIAQGGIFLCDYNRDGQLDLLITDANALVLFRGEADGKFRDVTESAGLTDRVRSSYAPAVFVDLDDDAYEDLIVGLQLFRNNRDGTFADVTALSNFRIPQDAGAFAVADYDLDGRMDVYVLRASPGPFGRSRVSWIGDQTGPGNQLWRNIGNWKFRNVTASTRTSAGRRSCFAAAWLDANSDGRPDLAVSDEFGSSVLLVNHEDGQFTEHPLKQPFGGFCMGIVAGDLDNDGHPDLYLANMASKAGDRITSNLPPDAYTPEVRAKVKEFVTGNEMLRNRGDLTFEPVARQVGVPGPGWSYGSQMVDLNNDGWLDIYAPGGFLSHSRGEPDG